MENLIRAILEANDADNSEGTSPEESGDVQNNIEININIGSETETEGGEDDESSETDDGTSVQE